jgi:hypothetical protein
MSQTRPVKIEEAQNVSKSLEQQLQKANEEIKRLKAKAPASGIPASRDRHGSFYANEAGQLIPATEAGALRPSADIEAALERAQRALGLTREQAKLFYALGEIDAEQPIARLRAKPGGK